MPPTAATRNNNTASDTGSVAEQVTVEIESPTVTPTPTPTPIPTPTPDPTVTSLRRFGFHEQRTQFVLTFGSELDPARAQNIRNYRLAPIGPKGHLGPRIRLVSAVYDPLTLTVAIHPAHRVYLFDHYQLVVNGRAPDGLAGPTGPLLDGRGNGEPGSDYVKVFGPRILAGTYRDFPARTTQGPGTRTSTGRIRRRKTQGRCRAVRSRPCGAAESARRRRAGSTSG